MYSKIVGFELKYRFSKWMTYIFMAMMIFQAAWYAKGSFEFYVNDATNFNAAGIIYQSLAGGGMLMIIAIAVITGTALFKDIEFKTAETFYSYPVSDKTWFLGKFTAAYLVNLSICLSYTLGFSILQYTGIAEPDKFGPVPWGQLLHAFLIFSVPNMFIVTAIALSLVVFFRTMAASYMGIFLVTMLFIIAEGTRENSAFITAVYLIDPFCFTHTKDVVESMTVAQKNFSYLPLEGIYWANRIIWLVIAGTLTAVATRKFSFSYFLTKPVNKKKTFDDNAEISFSQGLAIAVNKVFGVGENIKKLVRLSFLEIKNTTRPVGFKITFGILAIMFFGYNIMWNAEYYIHTDTLPITSSMTFTRLPNGVFILILLSIFAGELLFKERSSQMWQLTDALPVPTWVSYLSKYIAMAAVAMMFVFALFIPGLLVQIIQGFYDFEISVYLNDLFSYHFGWLNYLMVIALAFFVGSVFSQRFVAHIITVAILLFIIVMADIEIIEQVRFMFPFTPGIEDYSEMAGYGIYDIAAGKYALMWTFLSLVFIIAGIWFWNRGSIQPPKSRFALGKTQMHIVGKLAIVILLVGFFFLQNSIVAKEQEIPNFQTKHQQDENDAEYEKLFKYIEEQNQPYVCGLDLTIDIQPAIRKADYSFEMQLTNKDSSTIDSLHMNLKDFAVLHEISLNGTALSHAWFNEEHNQLAYHLAMPIAAGDTVSLKGSGTLQYTGFSSIDPQPALVFNGSFIETDIVPHIGYNYNKELNQNRMRGDLGLEKLTSRMDDISDMKSLENDAICPNALWQNTTIRVRTSSDQTAFASGKFIGTETIEGKEYAVYKTEKPASMDWQIGTAKYQTYTASVKNIDLSILYDERHDYNLEHMKDAVEKGIDYLEKYFGAYPYAQLRITEIPFYNDEDFYATPNQIAISEKHCWTADGRREKDLSYIYYTLCREVFVQWVQQNVQVADVQGADMILKAIPEAYALAYVRQQFGDEILDIYVKKKQDRYGKGRGNESNTESPLIYADGADYLEVNKGAMELLYVMQEIGITEFSTIFNSWVAETKKKNLVFKDFYEIIESKYPVDGKVGLTDRFEKVL